MIVFRVPRSFSSAAIEAVLKIALAQAAEAAAEMKAAARAGDLIAYRAARGRYRRALARAEAWRRATEEVRR